MWSRPPPRDCHISEYTVYETAFLESILMLRSAHAGQYTHQEGFYLSVVAFAAHGYFEEGQIQITNLPSRWNNHVSLHV